MGSVSGGSTHKKGKTQANTACPVRAANAAVLIASIPLCRTMRLRESTDDAQVDGHVVPISPRISGTIIAVLVNDNEEVAAGQELVKLDPADYQDADGTGKGRHRGRAGPALRKRLAMCPLPPSLRAALFARRSQT